MRRGITTGRNRTGFGSKFPFNHGLLHRTPQGTHNRPHNAVEQRVTMPAPVVPKRLPVVETGRLARSPIFEHRHGLDRKPVGANQLVTP
jgi:hypothetical protein